MKPLENKVAVVAGATRGAGRGIARALGEAGATVYCSGRSVRGRPATPGRSETIDETAELVTAAGGHGIAVRTDHTVEREVEALFARVREAHGRLDVLVNDIWGGDALTEWGKTFWQVDVAQGFTLLERAVHTHIITSRHGVPLMLEGAGGLVVEITDGVFHGYRAQLFYDLCKTSVIRLAYAMATELQDHPITALALTPGFLRSEAVLDHFGVREDNWRDAIAKDRHFAESETPWLVGRAVVALATDPDVRSRAGRAWSTWELSRHYGFTDIDGRQPHWDDYLDRVVGEILDAANPSPEEKFLLSMRVHQLEFDPDRVDQRARIEALLKADESTARPEPSEGERHG